VTDFYDPSAGLEVWIIGFFNLFVTAPFNMGYKAAQDDDFQSRFAIEAFIQTQMLRILEYIRSINDYRIKQSFQLRYIMTIRPGDYQREGNASAVYEEVTFAPHFFPDP
jgi:acetaldehyde dehydrogenase (acetylating)